MAVTRSADIEITAFDWVPDFFRGLGRDLRVRWALEEIGLDYRVRLLGTPRPADYLREQPFDQVPCYRDGTVQLFESGAIVQYLGERDERLLPRDIAARARAIQWTYAALNSVEPALMQVFTTTMSFREEELLARSLRAFRARLRRGGAEEGARLKLKRVADWLGDKQWLEDRFTMGDLMMATVLRIVGHTDLVAEQPVLAAYLARCEARPAFQRALQSQLDTFSEQAQAA